MTESERIQKIIDDYWHDDNVSNKQTIARLMRILKRVAKKSYAKAWNDASQYIHPDRISVSNVLDKDVQDILGNKKKNTCDDCGCKNPDVETFNQTEHLKL